MKKITAFLVIFIFVGTASFAQFQIKPSAGFAVLGDLGLGNGRIISNASFIRSQQIQNFNAGGGMFMDVTYAELYVGVSYGFLRYVNKQGTRYSSGNAYSEPLREFRGNALQLGISLLGKYPIDIGPITLFPILGFNYNTFMFAWDKKGAEIAQPVKTFSQFGFQTGAGFDYDLGNRIYFRLELLFQLRFVSERMNNYYNFKGVNGSANTYQLPGMGPVMKAGFGFKFY